jgi:hypothetical protein
VRFVGLFAFLHGQVFPSCEARGNPAIVKGRDIIYFPVALVGEVVPSCFYGLIFVGLSFIDLLMDV